jgi:hypothetical protein
MTMHLIRGMTSLNTRKRKPKTKTKRMIEAEAEHARFLARAGYKGNSKDYRYEIPDYNTGPRVTSDVVAANGAKKASVKYTGNEILGIATTHKSNMVPIRKDNKQAAVDAASMRR